MGKSFKQGKNREKYREEIKKKNKNKNYSVKPFLEINETEK